MQNNEKDMLSENVYQTSIENLGEITIFRGNTVCACLAMFQHNICNNTRYYSKHTKKPENYLKYVTLQNI